MKSLLNYRDPLKMIILDWAGTTLDYGCMAPAVVFQEVFRLKDVPITIDEAREPMGAHKRVHIDKITQIETVRDRWFEVHGAYPVESDVDEMFANFIPLQEACLPDHAEMIPGALEAIDAFREEFGLTIGSTTGFMTNMCNILLDEAKTRGYEPDFTVCAEEVIEGRPAPWMCLQNANLANIWPLSACVKVDDTCPGVLEGVNAGMWTIGLAKTGNEIGLPLAEIEVLDPEVLEERLRGAYERLYASGANFVVDSLAEVPDILRIINMKLANGETPY